MEVKSTNYRKLLEELYLIAELKPGKTISTKDLRIINHNILTSWYRWLNNEDRKLSLEWIYQVFDKSKKIIQEVDEPEKKAILMALKSAREGISTLLTTYSDDSYICSKVNTLLSEIHIVISREDPIFIPVWLRQSPPKTPPNTPTLDNILD